MNHYTYAYASRLRCSILETAHLLFVSKGYETTTLEDIGERLDIDRDTVLSFFPSTDDILETLWTGTWREVIPRDWTQQINHSDI